MSLGAWFLVGVVLLQVVVYAIALWPRPPRKMHTIPLMGRLHLNSRSKP